MMASVEGASSGLGRRFAEVLAAHGAEPFATMAELPQLLGLAGRGA